MGSSTTEDQAIKALYHVTEIGFVASLKLRDGAARITNVGKGLPHRGPVHVSVSQIDPRVAVFLAFEIFDVDFDNAVAKRVNPILRKAVKQNIAHIEPGFDPRALKFTDILHHLERAQKKFVPHFLNSDDH